MKIIERYYAEVEQQLQNSLKQEAELEQAAEMIAATVMNRGIVHVFGCGHSQMFGEELCFRTGGLVPINAIMIPQYNIYPQVRLSQLMERNEGFAYGVLDAQYTTPADTMVIVSVSGRNPAGIDMALAAKEKGMNVICLTSLDYTEKVSSRHSSGKKLKDVSDLVLDLPCVEGDAVLSDPSVKERFCSTSTVVGMSILIGVMGEAIVKLGKAGADVPVWVSGNLDRGDQVNAAYLKQYKGKIDIL
ncbi:MAG: sugar isomerase domain-containing protein [Erysipelotrichia bacterium]|nr:sugar isomerase domain-containing protein [Erysipelotrichia bacterium]